LSSESDFEVVIAWRKAMAKEAGDEHLKNGVNIPDFASVQAHEQDQANYFLDYVRQLTIGVPQNLLKPQQPNEHLKVGPNLELGYDEKGNLASVVSSAQSFRFNEDLTYKNGKLTSIHVKDDQGDITLAYRQDGSVSAGAVTGRNSQRNFDLDEGGTVTVSSEHEPNLPTIDLVNKPNRHTIKITQADQVGAFDYDQQLRFTKGDLHIGNNRFAVVPGSEEGAGTVVER
jgi:hypothetical protein